MRTAPVLFLAAPLLAAAFVAGAGGGCEGPCASGIYNCPAGGGWVYLPDAVSAPLATVKVDSPCLLASPSTGEGRYIGVEIPGAVTASCAVHATLTDGTELSATLLFTPLMCCGNSSAAPQTLSPVASASMDAGTG